MHKFKIYDQVIIVDRWAQYTTPKEKDTIALTHFTRERRPIVLRWEATWKNHRIKWEIVKIIDEDDKYWVRLPDYGKHIVIGEYWLALDDQNSITNTTDLHGSDPDQRSYEETYVRVSCEEDYNTTVKFYEKKWIKGIDNERQDRIRYIRTDHLWKRLYTWSERLLKENCSDLRDITHEVLYQTPTSFNLSPSTPMTNTLEQLKFDKYVKANESKIVDLSDSIDNQITLANTIGKIVGEFYVRVKTINQSMSRAFESCNKELLDEAFTKLKDYDKLLKSEAFTTLAAAFKNFKSASDKLNIND